MLLLLVGKKTDMEQFTQIPLGSQPFQDSTVADFWIGATTFINPPQWSWSDGSFFNYTEWAPGQPENLTGEACAATSIVQGTWSSQDCYKLKPSVCKIAKGASPPAYIQCPHGWIYFQPTKSCFGLTVDETHSHIEGDWTTAEKHCQTFGGHLPSFHSHAEIEVINGKSLNIIGFY